MEAGVIVRRLRITLAARVFRVRSRGRARAPEGQLVTSEAANEREAERQRSQQREDLGFDAGKHVALIHNVLGTKIRARRDQLGLARAPLASAR